MCLAPLDTGLERPSGEPRGGGLAASRPGSADLLPHGDGPLAYGVSASVDAPEGCGPAGGAEPAAALRFRRKWSPTPVHIFKAVHAWGRAVCFFQSALLRCRTLYICTTKHIDLKHTFQ